MEHQQSYVLRTVEERKVRLIRLWFCDVLGQLKSVAISPVELESVFEDGIQFDGSAIDGFSRVQESDVLAIPDASSFQLMTWGDGAEVSARMFCDLVNLDGSPFEGDPRQVLKRNLQRAHDAGFTLMCAPEVEFFYLESDDPSQAPVPLDTASYFDLTTKDVSSDIRRATIQRLEATGIPIGHRVCGVLAIEIASGELVLFRCGAVVLATGGIGQLFKWSFNPPGNTGDGSQPAATSGSSATISGLPAKALTLWYGESPGPIGLIGSHCHRCWPALTSQSTNW